MTARDPTGRFSDRAGDYARSRPGYPPELLAWLRADHGVERSWVVADVGAGTGISARLFLEAGHAVLAVEPNAAMRAEAEAALGGHPGFRSVAASAEATGLPDAGVDLVVAAQAFHWFDRAAVRREWARILRPGGLALLVWNARRAGGTPFLEGYERLLRAHSREYLRVAELWPDAAEVARWFGGGLRGSRAFENRQPLDLAGLRGRLLSSSYAPPPGDPAFAPMMEELRRLFEASAEGGRVALEYETRAYVGALSP